MRAHERQEPVSTEDARVADDRVEVLVEDLFIEEYPMVEPAEEEPSRHARGVTASRRRRATPLVFGLLVAGVVVLASAIFGRRSKRQRGRSRLVHLFA